MGQPARCEAAKGSAWPPIFDQVVVLWQESPPSEKRRPPVPRGSRLFRGGNPGPKSICPYFYMSLTALMEPPMSAPNGATWVCVFGLRTC